MTIPASICLIWLLFFFYCVIGWVVESTYCSIPAGHFINRGFLNGPYLPIYGSGAIGALLLFGRLEDPFQIFLLGGTLCCALEWVTSWAMEALYHARWWDYSDMPLNLQGRIWAGGFVEFGVCIVLVVLHINPPVVEALGQLPEGIAIPLAAASFACMSCDLIVTHIGVSRMRDKMDELVSETRERAESLAVKTRERAEGLATETRERAESLAATGREQAESMAAEQLQRIDSLTTQAREQAQALATEGRQNARELRRKLAQPDLWEQALEWQLGKRLRMAEDKVRLLRPDLPQLPELDGAARHFREHLNRQELRMLEAFPGLRPSDYRRLARELAERFGEDER